MDCLQFGMRSPFMVRKIPTNNINLPASVVSANRVDIDVHVRDWSNLKIDALDVSLCCDNDHGAKIRKSKTDDFKYMVTATLDNKAFGVAAGDVPSESEVVEYKIHRYLLKHIALEAYLKDWDIPVVRYHLAWIETNAMSDKEKLAIINRLLVELK